MFVNGSTATECSGGENAAGVTGATATGEAAVVGVGVATIGAEVEAAVAACSIVARFESQNLSAAKYASAMAITTTIARFRRCPVRCLIDRCGSTSAVGLSPSGVISYTHANRSTAGKPTAISTTTSRFAHAGTSSM